MRYTVMRAVAEGLGRVRATLTLLCAAAVLPMTSGCNPTGAREGGRSAASADTTFPPLLTDAELARMHRIPLDTLPVHVEPADNILPGPAARLVVTDSTEFPAAWALAGAHGTPPLVDFRENAVVLIGTAVHGGTWSVTADSVFALQDRLYVLVHEHTTCALIDIFGRGTVALRISRNLARHVVFVERPFDSCGDHEAL